MATGLLNPPPGYEWINRLTGWRMAGEILHVTAATSSGGSVEIALSAESPEIWRVRLAPDATPFPALPTLVPALRLAEHASAAVVVGEVGPAVRLDVQETAAGLTVRGAALTLEIGRDPWCLAFRDETGRIICRENPFDVDGLNRLFIRPLGFLRDAGGAVTQITESFHLRPDEHLFGLGEKFTPLDKTGQRIVSWTLDALGAASERAYKNVPLLISTRGYGLFLNTGRRITYELGTESCETYTVAIDGSILDAFLVYGPAPAEILERYTRLTGRAPVPPRWSFGIWLSGSGVHRDEPAIRRITEQLVERDIPCDVIHVDPWWMRWRKYADFQWDREAFPDPDRFIADLHRQGLRLSLWQHSYISVESDLFAEGERHGYFARRPDGRAYVIDYGLSLSTLPSGVTHVASQETSWNARVAIIDLTNPAAVEWYKSLMRPVLAMGADVFKTDFGEDIPADAVFANGMTGAEIHNLYPLLYNRAVFEVTQEVTGEGLVWSRSGYAGSQRYPTCWSGDPACTWDSLAFTIRGGLSLGLSGVPFWSNDIGGYRGHPSEALYIRWAQFGLLCSHARCHGESQREPWFFGDRATEIFRRYARLRYQFFPYLYACAHEAARTGLPVLRAMPLAFPADINGYDKDLQYMLGPWLLVAPVYDESDRRSVYLPAGGWTDFWTGQTFDGPMNLNIHAPLDTLPVFVRGGAMVPGMAPGLARIPEGLTDPLIVDIYPHGASTYRLIEDEGVTDFSCVYAEHGLTFTWTGGPERALTLRFHGVRNPSRVIAGAREADPTRALEQRALLQRWEVAADGTAQVYLGPCRDGRLRMDC